MSLRDAVRSIAADLEDTAKEHPDVPTRLLLKSFGKQLTVALAATENEPAIVTSGDFDPFGTKYKGPGCFICQGQNMEKCPGCSKKMRRELAEGIADDSGGEVQAEVVGDPDQVGGGTTYFTISSKMPKMARTLIGDKVFVLEPDNKLHFHAGHTETFRREQAEKKEKGDAG